MKIPLELIGGTGFFPAKKSIVTSELRAPVYSYEEELNILGIEAENPKDLLKKVFTIEIWWAIHAPMKWKKTDSSSIRKFTATYEGIELWMSIHFHKNGGAIEIKRIKSGRIQMLLMRRIYAENNSIFRANYHY